MLIGIAYCNPATLSVIVDRKQLRVNIVDINAAPEFKESVAFILDGKDDRVPTFFIEKVSTAIALSKVIPVDTQFKAIIFDTPDSLTFTKIDIVDAKLEDNSVWKIKAVIPAEFNALLIGSGISTVDELGKLVEKKFKPTRAQAEVKDIPVDETEATEESETESPEVESEKTEVNFINLAESLDETAKKAFSLYVVGVLPYKEAKQALTKDLLEFGSSTEAENLWVGFYAFVKNELSTDDAAKFAGCPEDALNMIADSIVDFDNIKFVDIPKRQYKVEAKTTEEPVKPKIKVQPEQKAPVKPEPTEVVQPKSAAKPKTIVEAIKQAFFGITAPDALTTLEQATAAYTVGVGGTKATFNVAVKAAMKAGADEKTLGMLDKMVNGSYGTWTWYAYGDMVLYGTDITKAGTDASVAPEDMQFVTKLCPVTSADKKTYEGKMDKWYGKNR